MPPQKSVAWTGLTVSIALIVLTFLPFPSNMAWDNLTGFLRRLDEIFQISGACDNQRPDYLIEEDKENFLSFILMFPCALIVLVSSLRQLLDKTTNKEFGYHVRSERFRQKHLVVKRILYCILFVVSLIYAVGLGEHFLELAYRVPLWFGWVMMSYPPYPEGFTDICLQIVCITIATLEPWMMFYLIYETLVLWLDRTPRLYFDFCLKNDKNPPAFPTLG